MKLLLALVLAGAATARADIPFRGSVIQEDALGTPEGVAYIAPNEPDWSSYTDVLRGKTGALISVGTFRALHDAAFGDFSEVFLFDYDSRVVEFNRANLRLIASASDRYEYMALLFAKAAPPALIEGARGKTLSEEAFWDGLERAPHNGVPIMPSDHLDYLRSIILKDWLPVRHRWESSLFGSDAVFGRIKALAQQGRIHPMLGDLTGSHAMRSLGEALKTAHIEVSVVDLSNAMEYIFKANSGVACDGAYNFFRNFELLPLSDATMILFTNLDDDDDRHPDISPSWLYRALPYERFLVGKDDLTQRYGATVPLAPPLVTPPPPPQPPPQSPTLRHLLRLVITPNPALW